MRHPRSARQPGRRRAGGSRGDEAPRAPAGHSCQRRSPPPGKRSRMPVRACLFDVDFTLAKPGPDLGPDGYRRMGERYGLDLDPALYPEARAAALATLERHPELRHDEELWFAFTERIVRGMGGDSDGARDLAIEMT